MIGPFSAISGLSPLWGALSVAGALAVLAMHLRSWRRARRAVHPGASIMASGVERAHTPSRRTLSRLLLAIVRAIAIALGLLAFDRPIWMSDAGPQLGLQRVIVLDVSASMGMPAGGTTRMELAHQRARELFSSGAPTAVLYAGESIEHATAGFTADAALLDDAVRGAIARRTSFDPARAVARARALIGGADGEIHVVTDGQHPIVADADVRVHLVGGASASSNSGIVGLSWTPARPVVGDTLVVTCEVVRTGASDVGTSLTFDVDGREQPAWVPPGEIAFASASFVIEREGTIGISARVESDAFGLDDHASATIETPAALGVGTIGDVFPLGVALDPGHSDPRYRVRPIETVDDVLASDVMLCAPASPLSVTMIDALAVAHRTGTPVVWVVHERAAADSFAQWAREAGLTEPAVRGGSPTRVTLHSERHTDLLASTHAMLSVLDIVVEAGGGAEADPDGWRVVVRDRLGTPRLIQSGPSSALLFDPASPAFARSPVAVVLTHELVNSSMDATFAGSVDLFPRAEVRAVRTQEAAGSGADPPRTAPYARPVELAPWLALTVLVLLVCEPLLTKPRGRAL